MAKIYTAQRMRDVAQCLRFNRQTKLTSEAADLLRQAADFMEREEKREKKYEYSVRYKDGVISILHDSSMPPNRKTENTIIRRPVGEWEVVK